MRDYVDTKGDYTDLGKQLDLLRSSRVSRWRPGRACRTATWDRSVAAYIVEKDHPPAFRGLRRDEFLQADGDEDSATYFPPDPKHAATLYHADGKTPFPYWYISGRPAGSINASAKDMARLVQFYLRPRHARRP